MILSDDQKAKIIEEYNSVKDEQYNNLSIEERQKLGAFFTPPELSIEMIEKRFDTLEGLTILDPTVGAGGLLICAYYAGADIRNLYGLELDTTILEEVCYKRFDRLIESDFPETEWMELKAIIRKHIKQGNALEDSSYQF